MPSDPITSEHEDSIVSEVGQSIERWRGQVEIRLDNMQDQLEHLYDELKALEERVTQNRIRLAMLVSASAGAGAGAVELFHKIFSG